MPSSLPIRLPIAQASPDGSDLLRERLRAKESDDLVFAVTGYVGSGTSWVAQGLIEKVKEAGFQPYEIKLSDLLAECRSFQRSSAKSIDETIKLQDAGKDLRTMYGGSMVAGLGIRKIQEERKKFRDDDAPCAFVIDSLKHPAEVEVLRSIYGQSFYLIGVVCNEDTRKARLKLKFKTEPEKGTLLEHRIVALMARDREEEEGPGSGRPVPG
ncbi:nucleoside/nucleotide kinase family protein [Paraliomyxa miuraensis]|uniref:hypothetical protein n=1 Tax=Paraliomyxa miuraensis TaxID=376150 RepID=UPI002253D78B|nr:hypothetical protein [Paraliomyxa miuraensis]MCX4241864.1 hypothetical protein [Paraliomyxa miuraensis]